MPAPPIDPDYSLASDLVDARDLERTVAQAIKATWSLITGASNVYTYPRFSRDDEEDIELFTTDDPALGSQRPMTNVVEIGLPGWEEAEYTSDINTMLALTYPITYTLGVVDQWPIIPGLEWASSSEMFIGTLMRARQVFKENIDLRLGKNVTHRYLQGGIPQLRANEKGEATEHYAEMTLTVIITGIRC